jgi:hypothetical protein
MALDTKAKRGAAIDLGQFGRPWLAEPRGQLTFPARLSLLGWAEFDSMPGAPLYGGRAVQLCGHNPGAKAATASTPGAQQAIASTPGAVELTSNP